MEIISGIYKITNKINNKCYIGQSTDIYQRWIGHKSQSRPVKEGGDLAAIHQAIRKYGIDNFLFEIIEVVYPELLNEREQYWIQYYDSYNQGYNNTLGGDGSLKYDYKEIISLWTQGLTNKEICEKLNCCDGVVTKAFRIYNISEEEVRSRRNETLKQPIVALDILTKIPLKIFSSVCTCSMYFNNSLISCGGLVKALKRGYRWEGYYWEYLNETNYPNCQLTDEEFLKYRQGKLFTRNQTEKERISVANRKVQRCSREELKRLIRTTPFTTIGKMFGISDNGIKKWCDYYHLPRRVKDIKKYSDEEWEAI